MHIKDLQKHLKTAAWNGAQEYDAFIAEAGAVPAADLIKLLEILCAKGPTDAVIERNRCVAFTKLVENAPSEELFVPFVRGIKVAEPEVRSTLAALLPKVNSIPGHAELCELLASPFAEIRQLGARALKEVIGTTGFQLLASMVKAPDFPGRMEAIDILVAKGGYHAIGALASVLAVGKPMEKVQALRHLGNPKVVDKDRPGAMAAIIPALRDADERVVMQAISSLAPIASENDYFTHVGAFFENSTVNVLRTAVESLKQYDSDKSAGMIERKFRAGPNPVRLAALAALETLSGDRAIPILVNALNHKQLTVRTKALETLTRLALTKKVDLARTILWLLRSRDVNVRRMAVELRQKVGDPTGELTPKLVHFLKDEDWWVRERVTDALAEITDSQDLVRYIVAFLEDPSDVVRRYAVDVLRRIKEPKTLGALVRAATSDADWWVREKALEAVGAIGDQRAVPHVLSIMTRNPELRVACLESLADLGSKDAAAQVASLLIDENMDVRVAALHCLDVLDDRTQAPAVAACADDVDRRIRGQARALLAKWSFETSHTGDAVADKSLPLLDRLLAGAAKAEADDFILSSGSKPTIKRHGATTPLANNVFSADQVEAILMPHLSAAQKRDLEELRDVDFSYQVKSEDLRFRANVFRQMTGLSGIFRIVKGDIPEFEKLGLPPVAAGFGDLKNGLVLVGGPTGSGKSTTLAGIIDYINRTQARHIITLEDPIEVIHRHKKGMINQREIGTHARSFASALRSTLREDPDVILVGEMRDLQTIQFGVTAAETGHLVFGTVHTVSADRSVDRLINAFPPAQQPQVRSMLAESLRAVLCQYLLRRRDAPGRVLAAEVMLNNDAVSNLIRKGKTFQIPSAITTGREQGMQSMDLELLRLLGLGKIYAEEAYMKAVDKSLFEAAVVKEAEGTGDGVAERKTQPGRAVAPARA